jgi:intracellular sulfur oxidation DsrE/DsrF family protein
MKTVFHVSSPDSGDQQHAMINAANLLADESVYSSGDEVVILANGAAVRMFVEETADHPDMVESLFDDGVSLRACGNALASMDATDDDLLAGVERVPSRPVRVNLRGSKTKGSATSKLRESVGSQSQFQVFEPL